MCSSSQFSDTRTSQNVVTLEPCLFSGVCFCVVGGHGCTVPLRPDPSKANGTKCFLRLLEVDSVGETKSRFLWLGMKRDNWKISAQLMHLCFLLKIGDLAFLHVCKVHCVLKQGWRKTRLVFPALASKRMRPL